MRTHSSCASTANNEAGKVAFMLNTLITPGINDIDCRQLSSWKGRVNHVPKLQAQPTHCNLVLSLYICGFDRPILDISGAVLNKAKKKLLCCPLPTDRKMRKNRVGFFFFFFFLCQIWAKNLLKFVFNGLKKHLYMRFDCIPPEFSPFRNFFLNIGKLNSLTVRKKKKIDRPTQFSDFGRGRAT